MPLSQGRRYSDANLLSLWLIFYLCLSAWLLRLASTTFERPPQPPVDALENNTIVPVELWVEDASNEGEIKAFCADIVEDISRLVEIHQHIRLVLTNPHFAGIICSDNSNPSRWEISGTSRVRAEFFTQTNQLLFRHGNTSLPKSIIVHEFMHAAHYQRRQAKSPKPSYPIAPFDDLSEHQLKTFNLQLDKGDQRIAEFRQLLQKEKQQVLSQTEADTLRRYQQVLTACLPFQLTINIKQQEYQQLTKQGIVEIRDTFLFSDDEGYGRLHIINKEKHGKNATITVESSSATQVVLTIPMRVSQEVASLKQHLKLSPVNLAAERQAYTFQELSPEAARMFYPEAYAFLQAHFPQATITRTV